MKLSNRIKLIASAGDPLYGKFASRKEVKQAKLLARGHYWDNTWAQDGEKSFTEYVSFSPSGKRAFFEYEWCHPCTHWQLKRWKVESKEAARLWSRGECNLADRLHSWSYEHYDMDFRTVDKYKEYTL